MRPAVDRHAALEANTHAAERSARLATRRNTKSRYAGKRDEVFADWRTQIRALASCPNAHVKLGGMGMRMFGFDFHQHALPPDSEQLATAWRPYVETCIEAFGANRAMFESNFPVDKVSSSYVVLWNAFKRSTSDLSAAERRDLFRETAQRVYGLRPEAC